MKKWEQFRHKAVFHFNPEETEIKIALQLIKSEYGYSPLFMGSEDEKIFYELAFEVVDAIGSQALGYKYGDESAAKALVEEFKPMVVIMRKFCRLLIDAYAEKYKTTIWLPDIASS